MYNVTKKVSFFYDNRVPNLNVQRKQTQRSSDSSCSLAERSRIIVIHIYFVTGERRSFDDIIINGCASAKFTTSVLVTSKSGRSNLVFCTIEDD